mmetsp:Transcript_18687/g.40167  ORF Transcript_18687/g.40167 Transcript_18687/m.40167 type:complete len:81 (+) Transcript_18687:343-585(+)
MRLPNSEGQQCSWVMGQRKDGCGTRALGLGQSPFEKLVRERIFSEITGNLEPLPLDNRERVFVRDSQAISDPEVWTIGSA